MKESFASASILLNIKHGGGREGFQIAQTGILLGVKSWFPAIENMLPLTLDGASALSKQKKKSLSKTLSGNNLGRNLRKKRRWGRGRKGKGGRKEKKRACTRKKFVFHSRCALEFCQGQLLSPLPLPFTAAAHFWLRSMALCKNCCA